MKTLYFECYSGISGDMTLGAFIDLGVSPEYIKGEIEKLGLEGYSLSCENVKKLGITATQFDVNVHDAHTHHHDEGGHHHANDCGHEHAHGHEHSHEHSHNSMKEIADLIARSALSDYVKELSLKIFRALAEVEAQVHGTTPDEVHFHEVGAVDSIIDIVGAAVCFEYIKPDRVVFSALREGQGHVMCQHGLMPVPVPATAGLAAKYSIPIEITDVKGEMITPTGAAIAAVMADEFVDSMPAMVVEKIGYGSGRKDFSHANVLRLMLGESGSRDGELCLLETNMDDCTGEMTAYAQNRLFEAGALDVWTAPIYMKKNRPAVLLSVLCRAEDRNAMAEIIFAETSSIGLRVRPVERIVMDRRSEKVATPYGEARVKMCSFGDIEKRSVEYADAERIAGQAGITIAQAYRLIEDCAAKNGAK